MIILGEATIIGDTVVIKAPSGFNTAAAVRLTNYSGDVIILTNITGENQSQEYLMPLQQMVYESVNIRNLPTMQAIRLGNNVVIETILVEWSTDPLADFQGTYPVTLTEVGVSFLTPNPAVSAGNVLDVTPANTTVDIPGNSFRHSITVINNGTTNIEWSTVDSGWGTNAIILPGSSRTLNAGNELFFQSDADGGTLEWFTD